MNTNTAQEEQVALSFQEFRDEQIVEFFANESRSFQPDGANESEMVRSHIVGAPHFAKMRKPSVTFEPTFRINPSLDDLTGKKREKDSHSTGLFGSKRKLNEPEKQGSIEQSFSHSSLPIASIGLIRSDDPAKGDKRAARVISTPLDPTQTQKMAKKPKCVELASALRIQTLSLSKQPQTVEPEDQAVQPEQASTEEQYTAENSIESVETTHPVEETVLERLHATDQQLERLIESWPGLPSDLKETIATLIEVSVTNESVTNEASAENDS